MATTLTPFALRLLAEVSSYPQFTAHQIALAAGVPAEQAIIVLHLPGSSAHIAKSTGIAKSTVQAVKAASIAWHAAHAN